AAMDRGERRCLSMPEIHFTPGPWVLDKARKRFQVPVVRHENKIICQVPELVTVPYHEIEANMYLICAAPSMLAALKMARDTVRGYVEDQAEDLPGLANWLDQVIDDAVGVHYEAV